MLQCGSCVVVLWSVLYMTAENCTILHTVDHVLWYCGRKEDGIGIGGGCRGSNPLLECHQTVITQLYSDIGLLPVATPPPETRDTNKVKWEYQ